MYSKDKKKFKITKKVLRSERLRWYGHRESMSENKAPAIARQILVHGKKDWHNKEVNKTDSD